MKKKGEVESVFQFFLAVIILIALFLLLFKTVESISSKFCIAKAESFKSILEEHSISQSVKKGEKNERLVLPCNADRIYIIDLNKTIDPFLIKSPLVQESIYSNGKDNLFILKDNIIIKSSYLKDLNIPYPYFRCIESRSDSIELLFRSEYKGTDIIPKYPINDCTYKDKMSAIARLLNPSHTEEYLNSFIEKDITKDIIITKIINESNQTIIKISIQAIEDIKNLRFIEIIGKCFAMSASEIIFEDPLPEVILKEDPVIMWNLNDLKKDDTINISFSVNKTIEEWCRNTLDSIAIEDPIINIQLPTETCFDTDGIDEKAYGRTYGKYDNEPYIYFDSCLNSFELEEYYCKISEEGAVSESMIIKCNYRCENGRCIDLKVNPECIDIDEDNDQIKSTIIGRYDTNETYSFTDSCIDKNNLKEWVCIDDKPSEKKIICTEGCEDGRCNAPFIVDPECYDSDGWNKYLKGFIKGKTQADEEYRYEDTCKDEDSVIEWYCLTNKPYNAVQDCEHGCKDGKCSEPPEERCTDTDGDDPYIKGYSSGIDSNAKRYDNEDYCIDDNILIEYICTNKKIESKRYECEEGCKNGRCISNKICTDTDAHDEAFIYSNILGRYINNTAFSFFDYCKDEKTLIEYYCDNKNPKNKEIICEFECRDGSCRRFEIDINFEPPSFSTPVNWYSEQGMTYRSYDSFNYGFSSSSNIKGYKRQSSRTDIYNTLIRFTDEKWNIKVPNGNYLIQLSVGDPSITVETRYIIKIENEIIIDEKVSPSSPWVERSKNIEVKGEMITLSGESTSPYYNNINFIRIRKIN